VSLGLGIGIDLHDAQSLAGRLLSAAGAVAPAEAAGFSAESLPGWYDDWVLLEAESWRQLRLHALEAVAGVLAQAGRFGVWVAAAQAGERSARPRSRVLGVRGVMGRCGSGSERSPSTCCSRW
jgi:hypothetical protein